MDPLVSFVVPCYKLAHLLPECVNSILAQTYRDFEILIMDNCSPDNTPEVAGSFNDPRVKHIRNEANLGHICNFNKGITLSRGKYVWLISADDLLRSRHVLERFVDLMERNPCVGYVFCRAVALRDGKEEGIVQWADCGDEDHISNGQTFLARLIRSNCIVMSSGMVRKECYDKVTLFPLDMPHACDWYLWCVLALHYQVAYLSEPMVCFRLHEESLATLLSREDARIFVADELRVLWRVGRQAELAGVPSLRGACKASIASRAAQALKSGLVGGTRPGLSEADFEAILRHHVGDLREEEEIRALVHIGLGDEQYWDGEYSKAARSYWLGLRLRPWWLKSWAKYLLVRMGGVGIAMRQLLFPIAAAARLKEHKWPFRTARRPVSG